MGIKTYNVALTCDMGTEELTVERSDIDEILFSIVEHDGTRRTVFVCNEDARMFAETILKVANS